MVERQVSESDCFDLLEDQFMEEQSSAGYETGLELGKKAGNDEGHSRGLSEGQKMGSEVGYYRGYTMTWIQLLRLNPTQSCKSTKIMDTLNEVLELTNTFPKTNETTCEEKLFKIRIKFKQSSSLLNLETLNK